ncbi:MAG: hypothetical protein QXU32_04105 [Nitrososphaerales archaeon]
MIKPALKKLLIDASVNKRSAWAIVRDGVVAEFSIAGDDKPVRTLDNNTLTVESSKARLQIIFSEDIKPIVAETAAYRCSPWVQCVYLCIPEQVARMSGRKVLTHLGSWENGYGELWDLGVGNDSLDACVIVRDTETHQKLKEKEGRYIIDDSEFLKEIIRLSPPRLFRTKFAHIMVKQRIPSNGENVDGPHTHLLPSIIRDGIHFPVPIPENMRSLIQVDPFGSVIDGNGDYYEWKGFERDDFQSLLHEYAENGYMRTKQNLREKIIYLLEKNDIQSTVQEYSNNNKQDIMRIIIAQLVCDKQLNIEVRKEALFMLDHLKAINLYGLKQWAQKISPELLK